MSANGNGDMSRVQTFNQMVRSLITMGFSAAFIYGFVVSGKISAEVFTNLVVLAVTWWFSRDQSTASAKENVDLLKTPPPPNTTVTTDTVSQSVTTPPRGDAP